MAQPSTQVYSCLAMRPPNFLIPVIYQDGEVVPPPVLICIRLGIYRVNPIYYETMKVCDSLGFSRAFN